MCTGMLIVSEELQLIFYDLSGLIHPRRIGISYLEGKGTYSTYVYVYINVGLLSACCELSICDNLWQLATT